uniref:Uncharacterized protein n=1 Tax=Schistocephalus solidus TaxID=70667 RepID=A0A0X3NWB7_SCHSO
MLLLRCLHLPLCNKCKHCFKAFIKCYVIARVRKEDNYFASKPLDCFLHIFLESMLELAAATEHETCMSESSQSTTSEVTMLNSGIGSVCSLSSHKMPSF